MRSRFILALAACAWLVGAQPVLGHAALVSASPGAGDAVAGPPPEIVATFSQDLDMSRTSMEVRDDAGRIVASGGVLGDGPRELRLTLPDLEPGEYEVRWTSYSAEDAELERGRYTFTVLPTAAASDVPPTPPGPSASLAPTSSAPPFPSPGPTSTMQPEGATPGDAGALLPIGVALVALAAIGAWLLRRR